MNIRTVATRSMFPTKTRGRTRLTCGVGFKTQESEGLQTVSGAEKWGLVLDVFSGGLLHTVCWQDWFFLPQEKMPPKSSHLGLFGVFPCLCRKGKRKANHPFEPTLREVLAAMPTGGLKKTLGPLGHRSKTAQVRLPLSKNLFCLNLPSTHGIEGPFN